MAESATILFVTAARGNATVLTEFLDQHGFDAKASTSVDEFDDAIANEPLDLVMIDADGFPAEVWARCEQLQQQGVPFFVISQYGDAANQRGREHNADRVFEKPLGQDALIRTIDQLVEDE